jgi:hypothetical protein
MKMKKRAMTIGLLILSGLELSACSFLRRYGANSYITNIPLFFKKQDVDAPQKKGDEQERLKKIREMNPDLAISVQNNIDASAEVKPIIKLKPTKGQIAMLGAETKATAHTYIGKAVNAIKDLMKRQKK